MTNTQTNERQKAANKWLSEFADVTVDANDLVTLDAKETEVDSESGVSFEEIFEKSQSASQVHEGEVVNGAVIAVSGDFVTVDIGYKMEGLVPIVEFKDAEGNLSVKAGDHVVVYLEKMENEHGVMILSRNKAEIIKAWDSIAEACERDEIIAGFVTRKVKGGLEVDIGVKAFLPGSQIDIRPVRNLDKYLGKKLNFKVIKFNKKRGNIVLSRKALLLKEREKLREETLEQLAEGMVVQGVVKNITDYGAFIDLGGMDGLLHITDMSWGRIKHPSELFQVGDEVTVKVLKYDKDKERVSLGLKQVQDNPWDKVPDRYHVGDKVSGKVVSIKDYGAFVELEDGVEGLIHVSEMSWTNKVKHPSKVLNPGDSVDCQVLDIDTKNRRISLGLKQLESNPWDLLEQKFPIGSTVEGEVKNVTDFGVFIDIGEGIDGLIHVSDISWTKKITHPSEAFNKGDKVRAIVLSIDKETEKFSLGIKQLERDPWENIKSRYKIGQAVEGKVNKLADFGVFIEIEEGLEGLIHISEIANDSSEKPTDVAKLGDVIRTEIISIDPRERKIGLSVKALAKSEERANIEAYSGNQSTSNTLGDILGSKLKNLKGDKE
ncbi:MAG: 30S ribosomal protein S1 [Oligoflexia bacterium]|nr:30S ribosomal protein S1 [Oligoflexia bacterium]